MDVAMDVAMDAIVPASPSLPGAQAFKTGAPPTVVPVVAEGAGVWAGQGEKQGLPYGRLGRKIPVVARKRYKARLDINAATLLHKQTDTLEKGGAGLGISNILMASSWHYFPGNIYNLRRLAIYR
jgi:hypothetical protein